MERRDAGFDDAVRDSDWAELVIELQIFEYETADLLAYNRINATAESSKKR